MPTHAIARRARLPRSLRQRAADAELLVLGFMSGVLRAHPDTAEVAFDGLRYCHRGSHFHELLDVMGRARIADAVGNRFGHSGAAVLGVVNR